MNVNLLIYPLHAAVWVAFAAAGWWGGRSAHVNAARRPPAPAVAVPVTAPHSRAVVAIHFVAFYVLYQGMGQGAIPNQMVHWLPGQELLGMLVIAASGALMAWARMWFQSWRVRARLDAGHQLATGGPFAWIRNPIYMGLNLLALGTALWLPNVLTWVGVALMVLGSDLRARTEEGLLRGAFGEAYAAYARRTARFVPGLY